MLKQVCWHRDELTADFVEMHPDPNAPDADYLHFDKNVGWQITMPDHPSELGEADMYGDPGSVVPSEMQWDEEEGDEGEEDEEGEYEEDEEYDEYVLSSRNRAKLTDRDLAAALMEQMGEDAGGDDAEFGSDEDGMMMSDEDGDEDDGEGGEDEQDEELAEKRAKARQLASEIKALEGAIEKKRAGFQGGNPIMMVR